MVGYLAARQRPTFLIARTGPLKPPNMPARMQEAPVAGPWLIMRDASCMYPCDSTKHPWQWWDGKAWHKGLACREMKELPKPPAVLSLTAQGRIPTDKTAAGFLGYYRLSNVEVNGHPAWQHCEGGKWMTRSPSNHWICQREMNRGTDLCLVVLRDKGSLYPNASGVTWEWTPGGG